MTTTGSYSHGPSASPTHSFHIPFVPVFFLFQHHRHFSKLVEFLPPVLQDCNFLTSLIFHTQVFKLCSVRLIIHASAQALHIIFTTLTLYIRIPPKSLLKLFAVAMQVGLSPVSIIVLDSTVCKKATQHIQLCFEPKSSVNRWTVDTT